MTGNPASSCALRPLNVGLKHPIQEILIAVEAENLGEYRLGFPPYDLRTAAYVVKLPARIVLQDNNRFLTQINARLSAGGSAILFPLPNIVEAVDELDLHGGAK